MAGFNPGLINHAITDDLARRCAHPVWASLWPDRRWRAATQPRTQPCNSACRPRTRCRPASSPRSSTSALRQFDGSPTYEIDLDEAGGSDRQYKVEVDAVSAKIIELSVEQWQIGDERDEEIGNGGDQAADKPQNDMATPNASSESG